MNFVEKMMFEGDDHEDFAAWMEEMKDVFIQPNSGTRCTGSGAPMTLEEEVVELKDIDFV